MAEISGVIVCNFCAEELNKNSFDASDTVQSCPQCGSVLDEEQLFSYDAAFVKNSASSSASIFPSHGSFVSRHFIQQKTHKNLKLITPARKELKAMVACSCEKLKLSEDITKQTQEFLLEKPYDAFIKMQKKIRLVGACIYIICRYNDITITIKQVAVATGCTIFEIGNVVKAIDSAFGLYRVPVTIPSLITTACSHLPNANKCEDIAQALCNSSSKSMVLTSSPIPQAIAYSVLASIVVNKGSNQQEEITKLCEEMSQVCEETVGRCLGLLKKYILTLLKGVPWVDMKYVKFNNVHHYIKDILKYEQKCGKFPAELANPPWCHKRESSILARKVKIQNAMQRIQQQEIIKAQASPSTKQGLASTEKTSNANAIQEKVSIATNNPITVIDENNSNPELSTSVSSTTKLDKEDKVIEELLRLGCSREQLEQGFYEALKTTSSHVNNNIDESEIESLVRKPEEVKRLKRVAEENKSPGLKREKRPANKLQSKSLGFRTKPKLK